jgi:hypothetical protein
MSKYRLGNKRQVASKIKPRVSLSIQMIYAEELTSLAQADSE